MSEALAAPLPEDVLTLKLERELAHPPEVVFRAWTEPQALRLWMGPTGYTCEGAEMDARVGGAYAFPITSPDGQVHTARGIIRELIPNRKLRFIWAWDQEDGSSGRQMEVSLEFRATDTGTRLIVQHSNFIDAEAREKHRGGWGGCLDSLAAYLQG